MYDLLQSSLRQRPEYLLVGEIRAQRDVAITFFQAMSTGHTSYTTFHADSVKSTIRRLEGEPLKVPRGMIESLDIISVQKQVYVEGKRIRRASNIAEITGFGDEGSIEAEDIFEWEPYTDSHDMVTGSSVLDEIRAERGWSKERMENEIEDRERVLRYMVNNEIRDYRDIGSVTNDYYVNKEDVMESIENGNLEAKYE
jgi:flagellar protein FlaI